MRWTGLHKSRNERTLSISFSVIGSIADSATVRTVIVSPTALNIFNE